MTSTDSYAWWQKGIIYQIYPRSYQDSNGDGVGDLAGVRRRLDYLKWLGVDALWLSPIYPSPMADFGYDISNYVDIDPLFGNLAEFDGLLADAHARGLKLILDFVPNHTSDQHPWFLDSRSSRDNPKRDWYLWHDAKSGGGGAPNNWLSVFGGSAWEWDEKTGQFYYHGFLKEQPDLNWRNPDVVKAMLGSMKFWLDRGVDGFRVDVIWHMIKDDQYRDNPPNPHYDSRVNPTYDSLEAVYSTDRPEVHGIIHEMRQLINSYDGDRLLVGEVYLPTERLMAYYGPDANSEAHMPYNFQLILLPWQARTIQQAVDHYEAALPKFAWPNWVLGNHDKPRVATRVGEAQARIAAMLLLTLRGTPTMYYGDEIGMRDVPVRPDQVQDPFEKREPGKGNGRDPQRSPMQWDGAAPNAGFAGEGVATWLPLPGDWHEVNVEAQKKDPYSLLSLVRKLIDLRRGEPALSVGGHCHIHSDDHVLAFCRDGGGERGRFVTVLNLSSDPADFTLPDDMKSAKVVLSTNLDREGEALSGTFHLRSDEGIIFKVDWVAPEGAA